MHVTSSSHSAYKNRSQADRAATVHMNLHTVGLPVDRDTCLSLDAADGIQSQDLWSPVYAAKWRCEVVLRIRLYCSKLLEFSFGESLHTYHKSTFISLQMSYFILGNVF